MQFLCSLLIALIGLIGGTGIPAAPPTATVTLKPNPAYVDLPLRGSGTFSDPDGEGEGASRYRWLLDGTEVLSGTVPQSVLLSFDSGFAGADGSVPTRTRGVTLTAGRFGSAVVFSPSLNSRLTYTATGRIGFEQGTFEAWVRLGHDLTDPIYDSYPRLFSLVVDTEHQLLMEVNADRLILTSRNNGAYYGTWPAPPAWKAGEWHYVAATWTGPGNRAVLYYDGAQVSAGDFSVITGTPQLFDIGCRGDGGVLDATIDDVRLSRRVLSAAEVAASYARGSAALNDEVLWLPGDYAIGDMVTFELTPCDIGGSCGVPVSTSLTITSSPLGPLTPPTGLLPAGTLSLTLSLTTTAAADCRWSPSGGTAYAAMTGTFQSGQGTPAHATVISGLANLKEYRFYVRCRAASGGEDGYEQSSHVRIMGPWAGGYPRIANIWGSFDAAKGVNFYSGYDLYIPGGWGSSSNKAAELRTLNPDAKVLMGLNATYAYTQYDSLTAAWAEATPGQPDYACLMRNIQGQIMLVPYWDHPMYNMTQPYCRKVLVENNISRFRAVQPELIYDGIFWDRLHDTISWLGSDIDADLNGQADDPATLNAAYVAGMKDFFTQIRAAFPGAVLMGNDGPQIYDAWINGRLYEWQLITLLEGRDGFTWNEIIDSYRDWSGRGVAPHTTFIETAPEELYSEKYTFHHIDDIPAVMVDETAASYQRMRYGLTSALMGDGLFSYDYGADWHGNAWWYDEFGMTPGYTATMLPPRGYLGRPAGSPFLLVDRLTTTNVIENGDFSNGLTDWNVYVNTGAGVSGTVWVEPTGGISGTAGARVVVTTTGSYWTLELSQKNVTTTAGHKYTLSFWARSEVTRTLHAAVIKQVSPWTGSGLSYAMTVTPRWQYFQLADVATVSATDNKLEFVGADVVGSFWLDDISLQEGALGVWARPFDNGLAVINTTAESQTVPLGGTYCRLNGGQAPLFQTRLDNEAAWASGGWISATATYTQFGATVLTATAGSGALARYTPTLAYPGEYDVLAWVAPAAGQSSAVSVTIRYAGGRQVVTLDQSSGAAGWRSLGRYTFAAGAESSLEIAATGSGVVVADAFKWASTARYNDGRRVSQVTLQPLDGMVLLKNCYLPPKAYLPIVLKKF